jgi:DNA polymerase-3 subunit delta'
MAWQTVGHHVVKKLFDTQLASGVFSHAYLLVGAAGIGKIDLAREFARKITGVESGAQNLDVVLLDQLVDGGVTAVREALATISTTPFNAKYKVVVVPSVDQFNLASSNAILKIIEEPSKHTIFILTADSSAVLATIKSRCQVFTLYPLSDIELAEYAKNEKLSVDEHMFSFAHGSPKLLHQFAGDSKSFQKTKELVESLEKISKATNFEKMAAVQTFAELEVDELEVLFNHWLWKLKRNLSESPQSHKTITAILQALQKFSQSMNKKLILQSVFLNA